MAGFKKSNVETVMCIYPGCELPADDCRQHCQASSDGKHSLDVHRTKIEDGCIVVVCGSCEQESSMGAVEDLKWD